MLVQHTLNGVTHDTPVSVRRTQSMLGSALINPSKGIPNGTTITRNGHHHISNGASLPGRKINAIDLTLNKGNTMTSPASSAVKKGILYQQRDRLFSRWKERFFILTPDYLHCFKKAPPSHISDMGEFIFKIKLVEVEGIEWIQRREPQVALQLPREGRLLLKNRDELKEWYKLLTDCMDESKARRKALRHAHEQWSKSTVVDGGGFVEWLVTAPRKNNATESLPPPRQCVPLSHPLTLPLPLGDQHQPTVWPNHHHKNSRSQKTARSLALPLRRQWASLDQDTSIPTPPDSRKYHRYSLLSELDLGIADLDSPVMPDSPASSMSGFTSNHHRSRYGNSDHGSAGAESRDSPTPSSLTPSLSFRSSVSSVTTTPSLRARPCLVHQHSDRNSLRSSTSSSQRNGSSNSITNSNHLERVPHMGSAAVLLRNRDKRHVEKSHSEDRYCSKMSDISRQSSLLSQKSYL